MKFETAIHLLATLAVTQAALEKRSPKHEEDPIGVVGGYPVGSAEKYPWIVSLQFKPIGPRQAFCAGSLIAPNLVLTAAHCTKYSPRSTAATVRRYNLRLASKTEGGIDYAIAQHFVHPNFTRSRSNLVYSHISFFL